MAPVLQCPECGTKHPLNGIGARSAFPCGGCGRTLKVPEQARAIAGSPTVPPWPPAPEPASAVPGPESLPVADPHATRVFSAPVPPLEPAAPITPPVTAPPLGPPGGVPPEPVAPAATGARDLVPGRWVRFGLWIVAVPLAFIVVFALAKTFGMLSTNDITDVALAEGWRRFVPIARLLPFVALVIALFVHGSVFGIARIREQRAAQARAATRSRATRSPRQSSRTRA